MKIYDDKHIKNIALLGSAKSGKTTLAETMLFEAGLISRRGTVEDKNTISDYHEIEQERGNSIYATTLHTEWRDYKINIMDTPGSDDFIGEIISSLRVADTGVMLINAQYGVEVGTELIWDYMEQFQKPVIFGINQLDHPKSDYDAALDSLYEHFGKSVTPMQYPYNQGEGFNGIIDLLKMTMYKFPAEGGKPEKLPIPGDQLAHANKLHNELVEKAAENDEALMELYFEKGTLDEDEMRKGIKIGMMNHELFPVFCLSAKKDMGSGRMMGFIDNVAPAAVEMLPEKTIEGKEVICKANGPTVLFIFKTLIVPNMGKVSFFKVLSGEVHQGMELQDHQSGTSEHIHHLFIMDGKNRHSVEKLTAGDIGATLKLKTTETNHSLHAKDVDIEIRPINFPDPRLRTAIVAKSKSDHEKLGEVLYKIHQEDPTVLIEFSKELKQLIISCQGELHLATIKWQLDNIYNLDTDFVSPKIPYRETIQKGCATSYRHKKQSGGAGQFGEVFMKIEPYHEGMPEPTEFTVRGKEEIDLPWGGKLVYYNCIVGGVIDQRYLPAILKGVMEKMEEGPITGSYVRDVRVMVHDGKMHSVDSNDISFKIAGSMAFKNAFVQADPKLLEPIYDMEIFVPEELMGDVMTDLQSRRSIITGMDSKGKYQIIRAKTPLAELDRYVTALRSMTQGRASFKSKFAEYTPVPHDIQKKLSDDYMKKDELVHS